MKGIRFGWLHSYDDLGMLLSKAELGTPEVKESKIDIPGADGSLDQTEAFGEPKFGDVTHRFDFAVLLARDELPAYFSRVRNALHGKKLRIILDDDPLYFYLGRCHVSTRIASPVMGEVTVECDCEPYKYKLEHTVVATSISGTQVITLTNGRKRAVPEVQIYTESGSIRIEHQSNIWDLGTGVYTLPELELTQGENAVTATGTGMVTFVWQEGDL